MKTLALALLGAAVVAAAGASETDVRLRAQFTRMYADLGVISVPIHRGGGMHQPENTLESFEYTWARNMVPEADIRTSKDDVIVCLHDNTVYRTAPLAQEKWQKRKIAELTLAELKTLDVGAYRGRPGQRIPTLEEVFAVMARDPRKFIYLDYKDIALERLAGMVRRHGIDRQVIFTTNRHDLIVAWRKLIPESQTMIWMGGTQDEIAQTIATLRAADFAGIYIVHLHYKPVSPGKYQLSEEFMRATRDELGKQGVVVQIMPWNVEEPGVYERLFKLGLDNVGTDYPDLLRPLHDKYFKR